MPRLKVATDANGTKIYPISISKGIYDTDRNQRLSKTLDDLDNNKLNISDVPEVIDSTEVAAAISEKIVSMSIDPTTGMVSLVLDDGNEEV